MTDFDVVWRRIHALAGSQFRTKTGLPFTYQISGSNVIPDRTQYPLHVIPEGAGPVNPLVLGCLIFLFLSFACLWARRGEGVGVKDRPAGSTAERP